MDEDLKKVFWVIVAIAIIAVFSVFVVKPAVGKIKGTKSSIESLDYDAQVGGAVDPANP